MSIDDLMTQPVTIVNPTTAANRYGGKDTDWASATRTDEVGWLHQSSGTEELDGRDALVSTYKLFGPAGSVITGRSRVEIDADTYEVDGRPHVSSTPAGGPHHVESILRRVEG